MKNILSSKKTMIILLITLIIFSGVYTYMLARPISYGMSYQNKTEYVGGTFEGTMKFRADGTMVNKNTNFNKELKSRYYYKDGYVFFLVAETDEEYEEEISEINNNFNEAIKKPFYADKINCFKLVVSEGDGYATVYTCLSAIVFAIVGGVIELLLLAFTAVSFIFIRKAKRV